MLFPDVPSDILATRTRKELLEMLRLVRDVSGPANKAFEAQDDDHSLDQLQPLPQDEVIQDNTSDRPSSQGAEESGVTDDVNALSMSVKHSTSYLGISSIIAVLRVINWLDPTSRTFSKTSHINDPHPHSPHLQEHVSNATELGSKSPTIWDEVPAINAYFRFVQPFLPLLDETSFRDTYAERKRDDQRWKLLLNAVLAMGSVALHSAKDRTHELFYGCIKEQLTFQLFESAHLETIQAVAILTGTYLHYIQQPNLANFLMGGILRMALALGLHRDYSEGLRIGAIQQATSSVELRRQVWWSLLVMDGWNSNYLGRPTMGRSGPGYTTRLPEAPIVSIDVEDEL